MRDIETIDSELRLLVAIRRLVREVKGRTSTAMRGGLLLLTFRKKPHQNLCSCTVAGCDGHHHQLPQVRPPTGLVVAGDAFVVPVQENLTVFVRFADDFVTEIG